VKALEGGTKMSDKTKPEFNMWGGGGTPAADVVKSAWKGTRVVVGVALAGLALGLGLGAVDAASS